MSAAISSQCAPLSPLFAISLRYDRPIKAMQTQNHDPTKCRKNPGRLSCWALICSCVLAEVRSILINSSRYFSVRVVGFSNLCVLRCMRSESRSASDIAFLSLSERISPAITSVQINKITVPPAQAVKTIWRNLREPVGGNHVEDEFDSILMTWLSWFWMFTISDHITKKQTKADRLAILYTNYFPGIIGDYSNCASCGQSVANLRPHEVADG